MIYLFCSSPLVINELNIGNASILIQSNANGYQEIVFWGRSERTGVLRVHDAVFGGSHVVLAVLVRLANTSYLPWFDKNILARLVLDFLRDDSESLIEWKHFLTLVDYLGDAVFKLILIDIALDPELLMISVVAHAELRQVSELGNQGVLLVPTEESQSNGLDLLISLGLQRLVIWVLNVPDRCLLPKGHFLRLLQIKPVDLGQPLLELKELILMLLDLELVDFLELLLFHIPLGLLSHFLLLRIFDFGFELLILLSQLLILLH